MLNEFRKKRAVINIRDLNVVIQIDVYLLSLQLDLISFIKDYRYIIVIDCVNFFYQWRVYFNNKHKFTVVNYRG